MRVARCSCITSMPVVEEKGIDTSLLLSWLTKSCEKDIGDGKGEAYCEICKTNLRAHKADLMKHASTAVHTTKAKMLPKMNPKQRTLGVFGFDKSTGSSKSNDLKLAVHIACHSALRSVDHLGEILKALGKGSSLENIQLHRTKCTLLIKNVIAPAMLKELVDDIGQGPYSALVDESTDLTTNKYMAVCIRFYSANSKTMVTNFLGLVEVPSATAENLYTAFTGHIKSVGLPLKNLHGLGTDGASNLCGVNHSLYTLLRDRDVPHLELMKCICHSMDKCARKACEVLPSSLEFLIRESRNWFSHSALRKTEYKEIYQTINADKTPPALVQLSETRWLAWSGAVTSTLEQWSELKLLFDMAATRERCYTARTLANMYSDPHNQLYLTFLKPVLREVTSINMAFQATNADFGKLYSDLRLMVLGLATKVIRPEVMKESRPGVIRHSELQYIQDALNNPDSLLPADRIDCGEAFKALSSTITGADIGYVKNRCGEFLRSLLQELIKRLPDHIDRIEKIKCLSADRCLAKVGRPPFGDLPLYYADSSTDMELLESQWRMLGVHEVQEILPDCAGDDIDTIQFWSAVANLKTATGVTKFKELASFALRVLSLPISNAVVERAFSYMNTIKIFIYFI
ncbi:hypothetical protein O0L34_g3196 [Tuta absoluta]|nr:hypothetical protein O0L34_g3196 [Tuta absoluta]